MRLAPGDPVGHHPKVTGRGLRLALVLALAAIAIGPAAVVRAGISPELLPDLAMMALLGITHVERNGHHYYRGLSMLPSPWQDATLAAHGDLYRSHQDGFACLRIAGGRLDLGSINAAPFGVAPVFDPSVFGQLTQPSA